MTDADNGANYATPMRIRLATTIVLGMLVAAPGAHAFVLEPIPLASATSGIAMDSSTNLWVAETGNNSVARITENGTLIARYPLGGTPTTVVSDFSSGRVWVAVSAIINGGDRTVYVAGRASANIATFISETGVADWFLSIPGVEPVGLLGAPSDGLLITDAGAARIMKLTSTAPTISRPVVTVTGTSATVEATVNPGGSETQIKIEYGNGQFADPITVPAGLTDVSYTGHLTGLTAGATYEIRVRAINEQGIYSGPVTTVTVPRGSGGGGSGLLPPSGGTTPGGRTTPGGSTTPGTAQITAARLTSARFARRKGTSISLTLSGNAIVKAAVDRKAPGIKKRSGTRTVCTSPPARKRRGQVACTRLVRQSSYSLGTLTSGTATVSFLPKAHGVPLAAGSYVLTLSAGASVKKLSFTVTR